MSIQQKVSSLPINIDDNPDLKLIQVASQSTRLQILDYLLKNKKMYPTQLEKKLNIQRRVVSFHLSALEEVGLVKSKYGLSDDDKRPQAVRYYTITEKGKEIFERIMSMLNSGR